MEAGRTLLTEIEPTEPELLDPRTLAQAEARVKASEATREQAVPLLERARTAHEFAKTEIERAKKLFANGTISHQELDNAEQKELTTGEELKSAQFALRIADYEMELARAALLRTRPANSTDSASLDFKIFSPINGHALRIFQESSAVVPAGARLIELGDPSDLEVEIDVLSADAVKIKPGAKVFLEHWGGEAPLLGRVRIVEPSGFLKISALGVEEQRVNVIADFEGPPQERKGLGDAYRVEARIVIWEAAAVLKVPIGALFRVDDEWAVFGFVEGRAMLRKVTLGPRNDLESTVLAGLAVGDAIILYPSDQVGNGRSVRPRANPAKLGL